MASFSIPRGRPRKNESEEQRLVRETRERRIQEEEERIREERKQNIKRVGLTMEQRTIRRIIYLRELHERHKQKRAAQRKKGKESEVDSRFSIKAPSRTKPENCTEEERQVQEKWEQRIQEEEEALSKEREQHFLPLNLTEEQRRFRAVIKDRARRERNKRKEAPQGKRDKESEVDSRLSIKAPSRTKPENCSEEERQVREKWEQRIQEEEETLRKESEQHVLRPNLTEEQKRLRAVIKVRARREKNKKENAARRQPGNETPNNVEIETPIIKAPSETTQTSTGNTVWNP